MKENVTATKSSRRRELKENLQGWGVVGPILLYYGIFGIIPLAMVFRYSLFSQEDIFSPEVFVGLNNFKTFFTDKSYYGLLLTTLLIAVFTITCSLVFGLLIAVAVTGPIKGKGFYIVFQKSFVEGMTVGGVKA